MSDDRMYVNSGQNLFATWRDQIKADGSSIKQELDVMNSVLGTAYIHSIVTQWEKGIRHPSPMAHNYIMKKVMPVLLVESGISEEKAKALTNLILLNVKPDTK